MAAHETLFADIDSMEPDRFAAHLADNVSFRFGNADTVGKPVGDDLRDMLAGKAAGMGTVAATYGYLGSTDVKEWGADVHIDTPLALLPLLRFRQLA